MGDKQIAISLLAKDNASKTIKGVGEELKQTHGKLNAFAGAFAGGALANLGVDFFKGGIADIKAAAQASAQTSAALVSTGGAAGVSKGHIEGLADSLEKMSGVQAESIQAGQNMLLTFTNIKGTNFDAATKTALDMSVALGTDASSSAMQLGKALNDPIKGVGALSKVGVTFDEGQRKAIKSMVEMGDTAGAQQVILKELGKEFGGSAKAAGETMAGKMEILKAKFGDVRQQLVEKLMPALSKLMDFVATKLLPVVVRMAEFVSKHAKAFLVLGAAVAAATVIIQLHAAALAVSAAGGLAAFLKGTKLITASQWLWNAAMAANPIGLIVLAIAALALGLVYAWKHSETFRTVVTAAFGKVLEAVSWVMDKIGDLFGALGHVPGFGWAKDAANAMHSAATKAQEMADKITAIPSSKDVKINVKANFTDVRLASRVGPKQAFAGGTLRAASGLALVGEAGPELVEMSGGERVHTASQTRSMLTRGRSALGGGDTYNITVQGFVGNDQDLAKRLATAMRRMKREGGGTAFGLA